MIRKHFCEFDDSDRDELFVLQELLDELTRAHQEQIFRENRLEQRRLAVESISRAKDGCQFATEKVLLFAKQVDIQGVLQILLDSQTVDGLTRIRFYRYEESDEGADDGHFLLVDSAGYNAGTSQLLRGGELLKFRCSNSISTSDSFWCYALNTPVIVTIDKSSPKRIEPCFYEERIPVIRIPFDSCEKVLEQKKSNTWVDIPLAVGGKIVGKLSCDFELPPNTQTPGKSTSLLSNQFDKIVQFWALAELAAPYLEAACRRRETRSIVDVIEDIRACSSLEQLWRYLTEELPAFFGADHGSVLLLSSDSFESQKLVLRKSSCRLAQKLEGHSYYDLSDNAMTSWVARNNRSLRIHSLLDHREREKQLRQYRIFDSCLYWQNRIEDNEDHSSFLAVPIPTDVNHVGGVIRLTGKNCVDAGFTDQDQHLLERIAREAIGRKIVSLRLKQTANIVSFKEVQESSSFLVSERIPQITDVVDMAKESFVSFFPYAKQGKKLFLLNVLRNDCERFEYIQVGGDLEVGMDSHASYPLANSLTGYIIRKYLAEGMTDNSVVFVNDLPNAQRLEVLLQICEKAETILAAPVAFKNKIYGVLVAKSDSHDIDPHFHRNAMGLIAAQAGTMFARRDHAYLTRLKRELSTIPTENPEDWICSVEELFSFHGDMQASSFTRKDLNLRALVENAVKESGCSGGFDDIPNTNVIFQQASLVEVMYKTLKEICTQRGGQKIDIRARVEEQLIELTVKRFFTDNDPLAGKDVAKRSGSEWRLRYIASRIQGRSKR